MPASQIASQLYERKPQTETGLLSKVQPVSHKPEVQRDCRVHFANSKEKHSWEQEVNSNALCGATAAPLRCMHLPDFKHIKLELREPLACWTWLKYLKDQDPFTYRPVEEAGVGKAVGGSPALYSGKEEGISRGFTGIKASLCGYIWLGLCDKGSWWSVGSAKHWILSRAL